MQRAIRNKFIPVLLLSAVFMAGCKQSDIQTAVKASSELAGDTQSAIQLVKTLYDTHVISLAVKDKLADALIKISDGGIAFNKLVVIAQAQADGGQSQLGFLAANFESVTGPFLQFLDDLKLLNPAQSQAIAASIAALQVAIIVVATALKGAAPAKVGMNTNRLLRLEATWQRA